MLIPLAGIIGVLTPASDNSEGLYIAFMFLGLVGGLALVLAVPDDSRLAVSARGRRR